MPVPVGRPNGSHSVRVVLGQHTVTSPGHLATGCEVGVAWGAVVEGLVGADGVVDLAEEASVTVHTVANYPRVCPRDAEPASVLSHTRVRGVVPRRSNRFVAAVSLPVGAP